ncbi:MAG: sensor histidine kinase [Geminicoccaceae bacterium]
MKIASKLKLALLLMLSLGLGGSMLSVWSARQASFQVERVNLAHRVYEGYLSLSSNTYQLFKQYGDKFIVGRSDGSGSKERLIAEIRADIAHIRELIGQEIDLVGDEEIEELALLSNIERTIEGLIASLASMSDTASGDQLSKDWWALSQLLNSDIDRDFHDMIEAALEEEAEEVEETWQAIQEEQIVYQIIAGMAALIAIAATLASIWMVHRQISLAVQRLLSGVRRFIDGDFSHRIGLKGRDELAEIGAAFDMMAERVAANTETLTSQNVELERVVKDRTRQLETMLQDVKRAEANRRRMLADVSHELRTPLTIIRGEAEIALRGEPKAPAEYQEALTRTCDAATHTARLVDDLLFVAKSESGHARLALGEFDLRALLADVAQTFNNAVSLVTDLEEAPLRGDPDRLRQAVLILLENARHHGGTDILMRLDEAPGGYRVAVEDDGPGMSDVEKSSAFERFFRGSNAAERYSEGVGLGLPVALSIAEAHGGTISLEDRPGGGLVAAMMLPRQPTLKAVS